jgi:4-hydroxy-tetrahydrodipicolinate reductase
MRDPVRVLLIGTGQMGSAIARLVVEKPGLELVGAYARRASRAGTDVGSALGLGRELGLAIRGDLAGLVAESRPEVAIQTTCSHLEEAAGELVTCLERGVHAITIAEEVAWPRAYSADWAARMDGLARERGATLLGTGVNPGFVLDLLVIALTGVCAHVESVEATRVNDLSPYGPAVLRTQGVGLTPDAFQRGLDDGTVVGHVGFPASVGMIAAALGVEIERIEETRAPILSGVERKTPFVAVEPGQVAGCLHTAVAYRAGRPFLTLIHPQQIRPEAEGVATGDTIEIAGTPSLRITSSPEIPGGVATAALAVNMVPQVLVASPGLYSMADLPVPAALLGDARRLAGADAGRSSRG